jgi:hypothetical protein
METMRISVKWAIHLAILLSVPQIGLCALQEWSRRYNVTYITGMATFQANPLRDKGSVIAIPVNFERMTEENLAVFRGGVLPGRGDASPQAQIVVSNVRPGQFSAGDTLVLAFRIVGMHQQLRLPYGEFVAAYHCARPDCHDVLGG